MARRERGFKPDAARHRWWAKQHSADSWLYKADVQAALAGFIANDFREIVDGGVLGGEFDADESAWRRLKRKRR